MTKDEYRRKLLERYPDLDSYEPITFAHSVDVLDLLLQGYEIGKREGRDEVMFEVMFGNKSEIELK